MQFTETITALAAQLNALLPFGHSVELNVRRYAHPQDICLAIHGIKSYAQAQEIFRVLGIQKRNKSVYSDDEPRSVLQGKLSELINVTVYCAGLPPSCRLETITERIPKTHIIENPTGEFVEIERTRVVCGNEQEAAV